MVRVLVTGASGFIGGHVVRHLAAAGHRVLATGRDRGRLVFTEPGVRVLAADLVDDVLDPLVAGNDMVVHCAALSAPWGQPEDFHRANVTATERLLATARAHSIRRFIHLGSPSIYFRFRDQLDVEEAFEPPSHWITDYARTKWESECLVRAAARAGLPGLVLRPRAVFGEGDRAILPRLLGVAARGWFPLVGGGHALIDVTHVDNLAALVVRCVEAEVPTDGRAYNVSNGKPVRVRELLGMLFDALGQDVTLVPVPRSIALPIASISEAFARLRPGQPEPRLTRYGIGAIGYSQTLDISRARHELDYRPGTDVEQGLARFAHWWNAHGSN